MNRNIYDLTQFVALKHLITGVFLLSVLCSSPAGAAGVIEPFSYSDGNLTSVSNGAWQLWEPTAGDAAVVNGAARYEGTTDVIRLFPAVLLADGNAAAFSFTINVNVANTSEGYAIDFVPSSPPFSTNTNYSSEFALGFDYRTTAPAGMSSIDVLAGASGNPLLVGYMSEGVTHAISVDLLRGPNGNTSCSLFLDNNLLDSDTFVLSDPRGINAV